MSLDLCQTNKLTSYWLRFINKIVGFQLSLECICLRCMSTNAIELTGRAKGKNRFVNKPSDLSTTGGRCAFVLLYAAAPLVLHPEPQILTLLAIDGRDAGA